MPTSTTITSNYAGVALNGPDAGGFFLEAFKEADTLAKGIVTVYENITYEAWLRRLQSTNGRRAYTCGHVPAGSITLSERLLKPKKFKDDFDICKEDFRAQWGDASMGASSHNDVMDANALNAIIVNKLADDRESFDFNIWQGDATNTDEFDGFLTLWDADAGIIKVPGASIDETNVEDEMKKALNAVPVALRNRILKVAVSPDVFQAYQFYLISKGISNGLGGNANTSAIFGRYTIESIAGLPNNTIVVAEAKNLAFGTGTLADHNRIDVVDEDSIGLLTGKVRGTMVYNAGVQYAYAGEIVWYSDTHPAPSV
jgi:hypothetical protein